MKTEFERSLHSNYMVIKDEESEAALSADIKENYQVRMLSETGIEGFLLLKIRYFNGRAEFCYDISSKQKMSDWFKAKKISNTELKNILLNLCKVLESAEDYLLDAEHIVLKPDYIFADTDNYRIYLCYCPFFEEDIIKTGQEFLQYLLEILDYNDKAAVELGYEVFRLCMKNGFGIEIIQNCLVETEEAVRSEAQEEWNSVVPVSVMKEEIEDEYEKFIIPYFDLSFRRKICVALMLAEIVLSILLIPNFSKSQAVILIYLILTALFVGGMLVLSVFYNNLKQLTRLVNIKGYIAYDDNNDEYIYEAEKETLKEEAIVPEPEETVLLAYMGKGERFRRLHYIGTRSQEDIILTNYPFTVGKAMEGNDYCLSYPFVSRVHFRIEKDEDKYFITDTNSRNGLLINGESLNATETKELCIGDRIELGDLVFLFQ